MQKTILGTRSETFYRERLSPSLWIIVAAAVCAPMATLSFTPLGFTLALLVGVLVGAVIVVSFVVFSPTIEIKNGTLRAGRAHIDVDFLDDAVSLTGEDAREGRGPRLDSRSWHLIRGGIDGLVVAPNNDKDDPVSSWVISTRTPDRLCAALRAGRSTPSSLGK